jgi:hypothetical protein
VNVVRFEVLMAVKMLILVFWIVTPHEFVGRYQHFRDLYCLQLLLKLETVYFSEIAGYLYTSPQGSLPKRRTSAMNIVLLWLTHESQSTT